MAVVKGTQWDAYLVSCLQLGTVWKINSLDGRLSLPKTLALELGDENPG